MRKSPIALIALTASLAAAANAVAASPMTNNVAKFSVANGSLHYGQKSVTTNAGLIEIMFTNNSTVPHNVSLEHNGEFEFGSTLTIRKGVITAFLTLAKGTYHVYSSVGTDEDKGMAATLIVK